MEEETIIIKLKKYAQPEKATFLAKYFDTKTGEKDIYLGIVVPDIRKVSKEYSDISLSIVTKLLKDNYHEVRLLALLILVLQFKKSNSDKQKQIVDTYLSHTNYINNWDLVDVSAAKIIGAYLLDKPKTLLYTLASSEYLWERRIAIVATFAFIPKGELHDTYAISKLLLSDKNPYIHKAIGWALREAGKKDAQQLKNFLQEQYPQLPRTTLRYAIERFPEATRRKYLKGEF